VVFQVAGFVLAPAVGLVGRRRCGAGTGCASAIEMCVDVLHVDDEAAAGRRLGTGRDQLVIEGSAMQPDDLRAGRNLAVNDAAVLIAIQTPRTEAERVDQERVRSFDVFIDQKRNDGMDLNVSHPATLPLAGTPGWKNAERRSGEVSSALRAGRIAITPPILGSCAREVGCWERPTPGRRARTPLFVRVPTAGGQLGLTVVPLRTGVCATPGYAPAAKG